VLRQGGLVACLSFLDFFQTGVQRVAVATAANMCRGLSTDATDAVQTAVPILTNLLQYQARRRNPALHPLLHRPRGRGAHAWRGRLISSRSAA
jgi:hypothetical protein